MGQNTNASRLQEANTRTQKIQSAFVVAPNVNAGKFASRQIAPAKIFKSEVKMSMNYDESLPSDYNHDSLCFTEPEPVSAARMAEIERRVKQHEEYLLGKAPYPTRRMDNIMRNAMPNMRMIPTDAHHQQPANKGWLNLGNLFGGRKNETNNQSVRV